MVKRQIEATGERASGRVSPTLTRASARLQAPSPLIPIFIFSLVVPIIFFIGPLRLSPYRLILLAMFFPCLSGWLSGKAGRVIAPDILILLTSLWGALAFFVHQDASSAIQSAGIYLVETLGAYLFARCLIRSAAQFEAMVRNLFLVIVLLIPFGIYETLTGHDIIRHLLGNVFQVFADADTDPRWGLHRVQGPFEHPIFFGVFCSAGFALSIYVLNYNRSTFRKIAFAGLVVLGVFMSLSSGPLSALAAQGGFIVWDRLSRGIANRWTILLGLFVAAYVFVDIMSTTTPLRWFIFHLAFSPETAFGRLIIWDGGSAAALSYPWFGTGGPWEHPTWMSDSMDMFWLYNAVVYGLPAAVSIALATVLILRKLGRLQTNDLRLASYRAGMVIAIAGLSLAGWAVHYWNALYVLFMFLLGSGLWMLEQGEEKASAPNKSSQVLRRTSPAAPYAARACALGGRSVRSLSPDNHTD